MTTPERLRRRQRVEGVVLILLAIFTAVQAVAFSLTDREQRDCVEEKFAELSAALDARADLVDRESAATTRVWDVWAEAAGLLRDDPTKPLPPEEQDRLNTKLVEALLNYQTEAKAVRAERKENPLPPYPVGTCERGSR